MGLTNGLVNSFQSLVQGPEASAIVESIASGPIGKSISLNSDGLNTQEISIADASQTGLELLGDFTIEFWARTITPTQQVLTIFINKGPWGGSFAYRIQLQQSGTTAGSISFSVPGGESFSSATASPWIKETDPEWHHVALTFDVDTTVGKIYVDGVSVETTTSELFAVVDVAEPVELGRLNSASDFFGFAGDMADFRIWNVVRTADQIADYRNVALFGNETGLLANWKFDDDLTDSGQSGNNLQLVSGSAPSYSVDMPY